MKVLNSPIPQFPGEVYLIEPPTLPVVSSFEQAIFAGRKLLNEYTPEGQTLPVGLSQSRYYCEVLPGIFACVERFAVKGIPENPTIENFPYKPRQAAERFVGWLIREIEKYIDEDDQIPPS